MLLRVNFDRGSFRWLFISFVSADSVNNAQQITSS